MNRIFCVLCCLLLCVGSAYGQDYSRAEIFGGYQYFRANSGLNSASLDNFNLNGWNASLTGYFSRYVGVAADFSGAYGTPDVLGVGLSTKLHTFMFGPVVRFTNASHATPYVHALFGGGHGSVGALGVSTSKTDFAWAIGGGFDYKFANHMSVRVAQFDYLQTRFVDDSQNNFRISTGLVFHF